MLGVYAETQTSKPALPLVRLSHAVMGLSNFAGVDEVCSASALHLLCPRPWGTFSRTPCPPDPGAHSQREEAGHCVALMFRSQVAQECAVLWVGPEAQGTGWGLDQTTSWSPKASEPIQPGSVPRGAWARQCGPGIAGMIPGLLWGQGSDPRRLVNGSRMTL